MWPVRQAVGRHEAEVLAIDFCRANAGHHGLSVDGAHFKGHQAFVGQQGLGQTAFKRGGWVVGAESQVVGYGANVGRVVVADPCHHDGLRASRHQRVHDDRKIVRRGAQLLHAVERSDHARRQVMLAFGQRRAGGKCPGASGDGGFAQGGGAVIDDYFFACAQCSADAALDFWLAVVGERVVQRGVVGSLVFGEFAGELRHIIEHPGNENLLRRHIAVHGAAGLRALVARRIEGNRVQGQAIGQGLRWGVRPKAVGIDRNIGLQYHQLAVDPLVQGDRGARLGSAGHHQAARRALDDGCAWRIQVNSKDGRGTALRVALHAFGFNGDVVGAPVDQGLGGHKGPLAGDGVGTGQGAADRLSVDVNHRFGLTGFEPQNRF